MYHVVSRRYWMRRLLRRGQREWPYALVDNRGSYVKVMFSSQIRELPQAPESIPTRIHADPVLSVLKEIHLLGPKVFMTAWRLFAVQGTSGTPMVPSTADESPSVL